MVVKLYISKKKFSLFRKVCKMQGVSWDEVLRKQIEKHWDKRDFWEYLYHKRRAEEREIEFYKI